MAKIVYDEDTMMSMLHIADRTVWWCACEGSCLTLFRLQRSIDLLKARLDSSADCKLMTPGELAEKTYSALRAETESIQNAMMSISHVAEADRYFVLADINRRLQ